MRADSAVEPTKSENITVTWRRSARRSDLSQSRHKAPINNFKRGFERGPTSDATI